MNHVRALCEAENEGGVLLLMRMCGAGRGATGRGSLCERRRCHWAGDARITTDLAVAHVEPDLGAGRGVEGSQVQAEPVNHRASIVGIFHRGFPVISIVSYCVPVGSAACGAQGGIY